MIDKIKVLLGAAADNYTEPQIELMYEMAEQEVKDYCHLEELDNSLELQAVKMAVIKLNRLGTEGVASQGFSGISESFVDGYPADIITVLNSKRRIITL